AAGAVALGEHTGSCRDGSCHDVVARVPAWKHLHLSGRGARTAAGARAFRAAEGSRSDRELAAHARSRRCAYPDSVALEHGPTLARLVANACRASCAGCRSTGARSTFATCFHAAGAR